MRPGPVDAATTTEHGDVVQVRAPRVGGGYRLIVEPWQATVDRMLAVDAAVTDGALVPA